MARFYPKHLLRREQRENQRIIARAVLAGFVAIKWRAGHVMPDSTPAWAVRTWEVHWPDGRIGHFYGRTIPAMMYLYMLEHGGNWIQEWSRARSGNTWRFGG